MSLFWGAENLGPGEVGGVNPGCYEARPCARKTCISAVRAAIAERSDCGMGSRCLPGSRRSGEKTDDNGDVKRGLRRCRRGGEGDRSACRRPRGLVDVLLSLGRVAADADGCNIRFQLATPSSSSVSRMTTWHDCKPKQVPICRYMYPG